MFSHVRIVSNGAGAVNETALFIDGVEQKAVRSFTLKAVAGGVYMLEVEHFANVAEIEGEFQVTRHAICTSCKERLQKQSDEGPVETAEITTIKSKWVDRIPAGKPK